MDGQLAAAAPAAFDLDQIGPVRVRYFGTVIIFIRRARRVRLRLALLAVLSLLFQQVALASYVCSTADMRVADAAMSLHCDGMPMAQGEQNPALCPMHRADQALATLDVHAPSVPPLLLPALLPPQPVLLALPESSAAHQRTVARRTSGIPPALRFRVLLI